MGNISDHFDREEFACRCGCGYDQIDMDLVFLLEEIRQASGGIPLAINSGCRCPEWNAASGGVDDSPHLRGTAADIAVTGGFRRWQIVTAAVRAGATGIGVAKTFIHVDIESSRSRPAVWSY